MTEEQIIEGNTLIAKFMGAVVIEHYPDHELLDFIHRDNYPENTRYYATTTLKYHKEPNWIIPVVERIEALPPLENHGKFVTYISSNGCTIQGTKFRSDPPNNAYLVDTIADNKIEATWISVSYFINWYNRQEKL